MSAIDKFIIGWLLLIIFGVVIETIRVRRENKRMAEDAAVAIRQVEGGHG